MSNPIITMTHHGSFTTTEKYFERLKELFKRGELDKYGELGIEYLREYTPKNTGLTSESWIYEINYDSDGMEIVWKNTNVQNGQEIAMILQYGHGTGSGGYVKGIDYINPALKEVFKQLSKDAEKEVRGIL
ncbi:MAG: HK97 gp10 family phage protein [Clostridiales bacterium]|nr:HK97 gp10 family phage protein [Clostridiales bacterium]